MSSVNKNYTQKIKQYVRSLRRHGQHVCTMEVGSCQVGKLSYAFDLHISPTLPKWMQQRQASFKIYYIENKILIFQITNETLVFYYLKKLVIFCMPFLYFEWYFEWMAKSYASKLSDALVGRLLKNLFILLISLFFKTAVYYRDGSPADSRSAKACWKIVNLKWQRSGNANTDI